MKFEIFAYGDIGFHFGNIVQAKNHSKRKSGRIIVAHLDIKNPIRFRSDLMFWSPRNIAFMLQIEGMISLEERLYIEKIAEGEVIKDKKEIYSSKSAIELRRILAEKGYDGIVYQNMFEGDGESYIAFYPEQVIIINDGRGDSDTTTATGEDADADTRTDGESAGSGITELSAADLKKDPFKKAMEGVTGYKELSKEQKTLRDIGRQLGWKVVFAPVRTPKGSKADGKISFASKTITIDPTSKKPIQFILKHELAHSLEQNKEAYTELQNAIMDSQAFKDYVKAQGFASTSAYNADIVARYKAEGVKGFDSTKAEYKANCEMVANFVGDCLFGGNTEVTARLLEGMNTAQRSSFVQLIKDFFAKLRDKLSGKHKGLTDEISKLEDVFLKTLNSVQQKEITATQDGESYSIATDSKNRKVVVLDRNIFNGVVDLKARAEALEDWIINNFGGTKHNTSDYFFVVMNERTAGKMKFWNENMDAVAYERKLSAVEHIDELIKISKFDRYSKNVKDKHKTFANKGWNYFKSYFTDGKRIYEADISVAKSNEQSVVYNIGYIKDVGQYEPNNKSSYSLTGSPNESVTIPENEASNRNSTDRIPQKESTVNSNFMQKSDEYSISTEYSLKNILEQVEKGEISSKEAEALLSLTKTLNPAVDFYTEEQYNNFGWVRANDVLTAAEYNTLLSRFADFEHNKDKYPTTRFGEAVIHSTECPDVIMYVKGTIDSPQITKIVKIFADDSLDIAIIRERIIKDEYKQEPLPYKAVTAMYGEEYIGSYRKRDYASFRDYQAEQEGRNSKSGNTSGRTEQNRGGSFTEGEGANNGDGSVNYSISAPSKVEDILTRFKNGEITQEEAVGLLSKDKAMSPYDIAHLNPKDANTTPKLKRRQGENKGNKESRFYKSLMGSSIFDDTFKQEAADDSFIQKYQSVI